MGILRLVIGIVAIIFVATLAFGQETPDFDASFPLPEDVLYEALEQAEQAFQEEGGASLDLTLPEIADSFAVDALPRTSDIANNTLSLRPEEGETTADVAGEVTLTAQQNSRDITPQLVTTTKAREIDPAFGFLTEVDSGFRSEIWQQTSLDDAEQFLNHFHQKPILSPILRHALKQLLLTSAATPQGDDTEKWLAMRVAFLHQLGHINAAGLLLAGAGVTKENLTTMPGIPRAWVENKLLNGDARDACLFSQQHMLNANHPFWRQVLLVCHVVQGNTAGLQLSLSLTRDEDRRHDPLLYQLIDHHLNNTDQTPLLAPGQKLTPLQAVVFAHAPSLLAPNVLLLMPDVLLRSIANNQTFAASIRLQAAEILLNEYGNQADVAVLSMLYDQFQFEREIVGSPAVIHMAENEIDGSKARAMLWQAARLSELDSSKSMILKTLWQRGREDNLGYLGGYLTPNLRDITASPTLAWFAPTVVRYALLVGDLDRATTWHRMMAGNRSLSRELESDYHHLALVMSLASGTPQPADLAKWWQTHGLDQPHQHDQAEKLLSILEAFNVSVPATFWQDLYDASAGYDQARKNDLGSLWLRVLGSALDQRDVARVLILVMKGGSYGDLASFSAQTQANIITALRYIGLTELAYRAAFEMMIDDIGHEPGFH